MDADARSTHEYALLLALCQLVPMLRPLNLKLGEKIESMSNNVWSITTRTCTSPCHLHHSGFVNPLLLEPQPEIEIVEISGEIVSPSR